MDTCCTEAVIWNIYRICKISFFIFRNILHGRFIKIPTTKGQSLNEKLTQSLEIRAIGIIRRLRFSLGVPFWTSTQYMYQTYLDLMVHAQRGIGIGIDYNGNLGPKVVPKTFSKCLKSMGEFSTYKCESQILWNKSWSGRRRSLVLYLHWGS